MSRSYIQAPQSDEYRNHVLALRALEHEFVGVYADFDEPFAVVGLVAPEREEVARHFAKQRPVLNAGLAVAVEPITLLQLQPPRRPLNLRVNRAVVFSDYIPRRNRPRGPHDHSRPAEIPNDPGLARVVKQRQRRKNATADKLGLPLHDDAGTFVVVFELGNLVGVELQQLQVVEQQAPDVAFTFRQTLRGFGPEVTGSLQEPQQNRAHYGPLEEILGVPFVLVLAQVVDVLEVVRSVAFVLLRKDNVVREVVNDWNSYLLQFRLGVEEKVEPFLGQNPDGQAADYRSALGE